MLLAAAASPVPPPIDDLLPDPLLRDEVAEDLPWLLRLLPRADVYLQDEVEIALHPTLTRVWCQKGRRGQRLVEAPGNNQKEYGFGLVDWRDGWLDWERASGRRAEPFCAQLQRAVEHSQQRGRVAMVLLDNLGIHTPKGSRLLRQLLDEQRGNLVLVYTPTYDPESNRIEWLWRSLRRAVEHSHQRGRVAMVLLDNLGIHTPKGSRLLRQVLEESRGQLVLVYTPPYDPESNRIEWLWRSLRRAVTHTHQHATLQPLLQAADTWAHKLTPRQILRQIGSPFADTVRPRQRQALAHAA